MTVACDVRDGSDEGNPDWFEALMKRLDEGGKPRPWRNITDRLRLIYYSRVLHTRSSSYAFSLRVAPGLVNNVENPVAVISERLRKTLKRRLGRNVDFFAVLELTNELHVHGAVHCLESEKAAVETALRGVGGKWRAGKAAARQLHLTPLQEPDHYAGFYCAKELQKTKDELDRCRKALQVVSHREPVPIITSAPLRKEAEARFERDRAKFLSGQKTTAEAVDVSNNPFTPAPASSSEASLSLVDHGVPITFETEDHNDWLARWIDVKIEAKLIRLGVSPSDVTITPLSHNGYDKS